MIKEEDFLGSINYSDYSRAVSEAKANNHQHWLGDEIPATQGLIKFWSELKHKRPDIVLRFDHRACGYNGKGYRAYADVGIAYKDAPDMSVGTIGMEMAENGKDKDILYVVKSDRIKNEKFATYSEGYKFKKTKNFANAVKNATQFLKPVLFEELKEDKLGALGTALHTIHEPAKEKFYTITKMGQNTLLDEMRNMIRVGYVPLTNSFTSAVQTLTAEDEMLKQVSAYKPRTCFVWAKPNAVEYQMDGEERKVVYNLDDVPQQVKDKVSVLQIGSVNSAIMDVGVKINNTMYWVFL
jgi:hypothetical protein